MKLSAFISLGSLGLVASKYEPKCGIVCLTGMECDRNKLSAPLSDISSGLTVTLTSANTIYSPSTRILGSTAKPGMFPWMAGIFVKTSSKNRGKQFDKLCGGSIINSRTILTAATCFTKPNSNQLKDGVTRYTKVHVGFPAGLPEPDKTHRDVSIKAQGYGQGIFDIQSIAIHKRFTGRQPEQYDAAIIILRKPIVYHRSVTKNERRDIEFSSNNTVVSKTYSWTRPVCLANKRFDDNYLRKTGADGESKAFCFASGYGRDQNNKMGRLNFAFMDFIKDQTCKNKLNTMKKSPIYAKLKGIKTLPKSYLCAQGKKMDPNRQTQTAIYLKSNEVMAQSACEGDTGSPLACMPDTESDVPSQFIQSGITSFGLTCGAPKVPGVYTRTGGITQWVNGIARKFGKVQWKSGPDSKF